MDSICTLYVLHELCYTYHTAVGDPQYSPPNSGYNNKAARILHSNAYICYRLLCQVDVLDIEVI